LPTSGRPASRRIEEPFGEAALAALAELGERLGADARREVRRPGRRNSGHHTHVRAHVRYAGTDTALVVPFGASPR